MTEIQSEIATKFESFDIVDFNYKSVHGAPIPASVLIPKNIRPGKYPTLVRWHGGCLITGHRLYPRWWGDWVINFALANEAITVSPDYRMLPEATGLDIEQDLNDFYVWFFKPGNLQALLPAGVEADTENLLVTGESAGGYMAIKSSFVPECHGKIKAIIPRYPMIDMRDKFFNEDYEKSILGLPQFDRKMVDDHVAGLKGQEVVTSVFPMERVQLAIAVLQRGLWAEVFGEEPSLYPLEELEKQRAIVPTWIMHGESDDTVPAEGTLKYVKKALEKFPDAKIHQTIVPGGSHGFDWANGASLDDEYIKQGLAFIASYWPKSGRDHRLA